ncbi:MAG: DNA-3-methyladenine glycosylase family protein [Flavobacterium sp.]
MDEQLNALIATNKTFASILAEYGMPHFPSRPEGFESLCRIILEQQVSLDSARAAFNKLANVSGDFTPVHVLKLTDEQIRSCGITRQKTLYIKSLAEAIINKDIRPERYKEMHPEEVRQELIKVKGIGNWTIDVYLMFCLQSPDVLPLGDIGILSAIKELWGISEVSEITELTKTWSPNRTSAAFLLWHYYLGRRGRKFPH